MLRYFLEEGISLSYAIRYDLWFLKSLFYCIVLTYMVVKIKLYNVNISWNGKDVEQENMQNRYADS